MAAAVLILLTLAASPHLGLTHPAPLSLMSLLVAIAVYVYANFRRVVNSRVFNALGPAVIGGAAAGVAAMWAGLEAGAVAVAVAYWGEPVMGYYVYKVLRRWGGGWALLFLASAAAYAYSLPVVLLGLWQIPATADFAKLVALAYFLRAVK